MIDFTKYRCVDLTLPYDASVAGYSDEAAKVLEKDGWNARMLHLYSHAGTHMDAPVHFGIAGPTIDAFTPEQLMGRAWVIHLEDTAPGALLDTGILNGMAENIIPGDILLINTGWSKRLGTDAYRNQLPRISEALAGWCVRNGIKMLGVEPPSVADVNNLEEVTLIHQILLSGGVMIVEGLCNLDQLHGNPVWLMALPIKIKGGDGAPCRVIAFEEMAEGV